jgi:hypothetical protein
MKKKTGSRSLVVRDRFRIVNCLKVIHSQRSTCVEFLLSSWNAASTWLQASPKGKGQTSGTFWRNERARRGKVKRSRCGEQRFCLDAQEVDVGGIRIAASGKRTQNERHGNLHDDDEQVIMAHNVLPASSISCRRS